MGSSRQTHFIESLEVVLTDSINTSREMAQLKKIVFVITIVRYSTPINRIPNYVTVQCEEAQNK